MGVIGYGLGVIGARVFTVFIMAAAFAEALALIGFVVALVVK